MREKDKSKKNKEFRLSKRKECKKSKSKKEKESGKQMRSNNSKLRTLCLKNSKPKNKTL